MTISPMFTTISGTSAAMKRQAFTCAKWPTCPPELPGFNAASAWIRLSMSRPELARNDRPRVILKNHFRIEQMEAVLAG